MAERIIKFNGVEATSVGERTVGESQPESDPRANDATMVEGVSLMEAVERLEPCSSTSMAYFDPDSGLEDEPLDALEQKVVEGDLRLRDVLTKTDRYTPLVNPRRSRQKRSGQMPEGSDSDLWHVPTSNYNPVPPRNRFEPLARVIDNHDWIPNDSIEGEFRERRSGGEVFGEVVFDSMRVEMSRDEGDEPVRLGLEFGWNYFGDRSFYIRSFAQETRCKNSIRTLDERDVVMAHNKEPDYEEEWRGAIYSLGIVGDRLRRMISDAMRIVLEFQTTGDDMGDDESVPDDVERVPVPVSLESFYEYLGFPPGEVGRMAEYVREEARNSDLEAEGGNAASAWNVHSGATYWLSWFWNGSEDSRAYRRHRRTADDILFNPHSSVSRFRDEYESDIERQVREEVLGVDGSLEDASEEEIEEIENRLSEHEGIATVQSTADSIESALDEFRSREERLDEIEEELAEV